MWANSVWGLLELAVALVLAWLTLTTGHTAWIPWLIPSAIILFVGSCVTFAWPYALRHFRASKSDTMARFILQARALQELERQQGAKSVNREANAWIDGTTKWLARKMGKSHALLFSDYSGLPVQFASQKSTELEVDFNFRIQRLVQFIQELQNK
jgi:hypothetical protein